MRRLALALLLFATPALAAVPTTTITGNIVNAGAAAPASGTITCTLSPVAGSATDTGTGKSSRVGLTPYTITVGSDGSVTGALIGNDLITPGGTTYSCTYRLNTAPVKPWTETWQIASSPSTIDIGAISRPGVTPLTVSGVSGSTGAVQTSNGSGALTTAYGVTMSTSAQDLDGDGTNDVGTSVTGAMKLASLYTAAFGGSEDQVGDGTVSAWTPPPIAADLQIAARAHAGYYSADPDMYLRPAVFDTAWNIFGGNNLIANIAGDAGPYGTGTTRAGSVFRLAGCKGNTGAACSATHQIYLCLYYDGVHKADDTDGDGTAEIVAGDVLYVANPTGQTTGDGTAQTQYYALGKPLTIYSVADGDGTNCPVTTSGGHNQIFVSPFYLPQDTVQGIDTNADGTLDANVRLISPWSNSSHASNGGFWTIGYQIALGSRALDGPLGPDLLTNGTLDRKAAANATTVPEGWTASEAVSNISWRNPPSGTVSSKCADDLNYSCLTVSGTTAGHYIETANPIRVVPGEYYTLRGVAVGQQGTVQKAELLCDMDMDGTVDDACTADTDGDSTYTAAEAGSPTFNWNTSPNDYSAQYFYGAPHRFWFTWKIPPGVGQVKVRFTDTTGGAANVIGFDSLEFRRNPYYSHTDDHRSWVGCLPTYAGSMTTACKAASYLINDPGTRNIVITGDSWTEMSVAHQYGQSTRDGLIFGLQKRFGRDLSAQVFATGHSGDTIAQFLARWTAAVTAYHPLYAIIHIGGVNDAGITEANFRARMGEVIARCRAEGIVCIFEGIDPNGRNTANYQISHMQAQWLYKLVNNLQ